MPGVHVGASKRLKSTGLGEPKSGHIFAGPNEGILFFDNVFPLKLQWALRLPLVSPEQSLSEVMKRVNNPNVAAADPPTIIKRAIPPEVPLKITEIIPRLKDGGAFVKFACPDDMDTAQVEEAFRSHLKKNPIKPWFNPFRRVRAFLVRGSPWLEDLYRFPSSRLKVEFVPTEPAGDPAELSQERLYALFRQYGKLNDIIAQPPDSKVLPKFAYLDFFRIRHAIMARNTMHGVTIPPGQGGGAAGTMLRLVYEHKVKAHWIRDWLFSHPRLVIPALAAIVATITVAVFDPIRTFFVKAHVEHSFHLTNSKLYRWFKRQANDIFTFKRHDTEDAGLQALWDDRKGDIEQIRTWLMETADTFVVVQGPRGSGKRELVVDQALKDRKHKLIIDCKPIQEARGDSATIRAAAVEVGYRPVFSWMNSISSMIDLAAQGTIGTKAGFSETLDTQLAKIWQNTATALKQVALEGRKKDDKDAALGDDEYLEAHPEKRPVVVIDNFLHKNQESSLVYDKISEWAASLTTANIAHVIFLTHDVSFSKSLSKALPDRVFRLVALGDCSPSVAKRFVITHLDADADVDVDDVKEDEKHLTPSQRRDDLGELDECIEALGGRLTDLEFLARRMKSGETPKKAVREIIEQSASEILKMYLLDVDKSQRAWTSEQAWYLVKQLGRSNTVRDSLVVLPGAFLLTYSQLRYNEILLDDTFKTNGESVLQALEQAELITINSTNGRPHSISAGKPVYGAAFRSLAEDHVLKARLDLLTCNELIKLENAGIDKVEAELSLLSGLPGNGRAVQARVAWLMGKLEGGQAKVESYENESAGLKKVLQMEF
ncbi:MAG: mitochondrial escape protein 2 [Piccolia ochrophora]|nr:MAG: mitochondrial escape protein 2 [Piccolia ochrophora]